ncbi:UAA transporter [Carpediemonas membranifera]|uniref:UAA transporter n=1 Tax=Carpediemonas membranifera TaxID=201153 RepID=A0A8J6BD82_9EUKA|nr:UAA transporter [Carpediemonas membranifera]|eukprot:KAG9395052.1 UAA transporter [Carpediemonas membranifera]
MTLKTTLRFSIYVAGVYVAFMMFGLAQERVHSVGWGPEGERFRYPIFLITIQSICNAIIAGTCLMWVAVFKKLTTEAPLGNTVRLGAPWWAFAVTGLSVITSMLCSNAALSHVDYPTQVLAKSCKMVAVMAAAIILVRKRYPKAQYAAVAVLTLGIFMFSFFRKKGAAGSDSSLLGVLLLLASLTCDGITATLQDKFVASHRPSALQLMLSINIFSVVYGVAAVTITGQLATALKYISEADRGLIVAIMAFGMTSGVGQIFLFGLIRDFGSLSATITTTTRKFFTILLSVLLYGHSIPMASWAGVVLVFVGLAFNIFQKKKPKPTIPAGFPKPGTVDVSEINPFPDPYSSATSMAPSLAGSRRGSVGSDLSTMKDDSDLESVVSLAFSDPQSLNSSGY